MTLAEPAKRVQSLARLDGVDTLRGLATFFVLMNHVNMRLLIAKVPYGRALPAQLMSSLVWNGQHGVQIFFAVSGFLITSNSLKRWGGLDRVRVRDFYVMRFARIAPLLLALLGVLSLLHFTGSHWFAVTPRTGGLGRALVAALTFQVNLLEANRGYLPPSWDVLWSLSVEETFYIFFPIVCWWLGGRRRLVALLVALIAIGPFARTVFTHGSEVWKEYSYLGSMDAIAMGCLTAILVTRFQLSRGSLAALKFLGLTLVVFILGFSITANRLGLERTGLDMSILALGACLLIAYDAQTEQRGGAWSVPLRWLGRRSYEIYLTHMFVVIGIFALILRPEMSRFTVLAFFLGAIAISGLLGELVARPYSEPMNRILRARLQPRGSKTATVGSGVEASTL
jgi:peptidoglycan/LPS O-acetylase OafA/YrhL